MPRFHFHLRQSRWNTKHARLVFTQGSTVLYRWVSLMLMLRTLTLHWLLAQRIPSLLRSEMFLLFITHMQTHHGFHKYPAFVWQVSREHTYAKHTCEMQCSLERERRYDTSVQHLSIGKLSWSSNVIMSRCVWCVMHSDTSCQTLWWMYENTVGVSHCQFPLSVKR